MLLLFHTSVLYAGMSFAFSQTAKPEDFMCTLGIK